MLSFIIPAHNEEQFLGATLRALEEAARAVGQPYEVIVVDDASTDRTGEIAEEFGARVLRVEHRQIAATRNAGARVARGEILVFVDADTLANADALRAALGALDRGAVGGGCIMRFDGRVPLWARAAYPVAVVMSRLLRLVGGCFLFCTREAFEAVGGFDDRFYAAEEAAFARSLQRIGRFAIPGPTVITSGRKFRSHPTRQLLGIAWHWAVDGPAWFRSRENLDIWYGERARDRDGPA